MTAPEPFAHALDSGQPEYVDRIRADERERIAAAIEAEGARLAAQHHPAGEMSGRIKAAAAVYAALARAESPAGESPAVVDRIPPAGLAERVAALADTYAEYLAAAPLLASDEFQRGFRGGLRSAETDIRALLSDPAQSVEGDGCRFIWTDDKTPTRRCTRHGVTWVPPHTPICGGATDPRGEVEYAAQPDDPKDDR